MATSHSVEKVVIMAASQVAKSELLMNVMGYYIDQEPSSIMMIQPTVENAEAFSKERIDPTIQASPVLKEKMSVTVSDEKALKKIKFNYPYEAFHRWLSCNGRFQFTFWVVISSYTRTPL